MPTIKLTPTACSTSTGTWVTVYHYLSTNSSYYPRQLLFTFPANATLGADGIQINKITIHGYVRNSSSSLKRLRLGFRPSADSGVSDWSVSGSSLVLDGVFNAIDGNPSSGFIYEEIERIYSGGNIFVNHIRNQFRDGNPIYLGVIQPDSGRAISIDAALTTWWIMVDYELLGNIPSTNQSSVNLGDTLTVNVNRVIGGSSTTLKYKIGSNVIKTVDIGTNASYDYKIPYSAGSNFPNSLSATMTIEAVTTLSGATYGTISTSVKVTASSSVKPGVNLGGKRVWASTVPADAQIDAYVQRVTGVQFGGQLFANGGATIAKLQIAVEGKTYTLVPTIQQGFFDVIHYFSTSGDVPVTFTATDSRGLVGTKTWTIQNVLPYSPPQVQAFSVDRATSENVLAVDGTCARATVQASVSSVLLNDAEQNSLQFVVQYRKAGESAWTDCDAVTGSSLSGAFTGLLVRDGAYVSTFDDMSGYDFRLVLTDRFSTGYATAQIPTKELYWDVDEETGKMGFGGAAPGEDETHHYRVHKRTEFTGIVDFANWTNFNKFARFNEGYKEYKTSEVDTGNKWYDGKRIYRYTIYGSTTLSDTNGTFFTLPDTPADIVHIDAFFKSGSIWYPLPWAQYDANKAANIYIDGAKICLAFASGWSGTRQVRVVIEYTK